MRRNDGEFEDVQAQFEKTLPKLNTGIRGAFERAPRSLDGKHPPYFYENGSINDAFIVYMAGYGFGVVKTRE